MENMLSRSWRENTRNAIRVSELVIPSIMSIWLVIIIAGLLTFGIRLSFIYLHGKVSMPETLQRALRFVPPAVFTAIFLPELLITDGMLNITLGNGRLIAGTLAIVVAWRTRNVILTILVGMLTLWILQVVIGKT